MTEHEFIKELSILGIELSELQRKQFHMYYELLVEWNQKMNLTGITEESQVYLKHFYDSATILKAIDFHEVTTLCDVGTGAGFPGIVLKILFPDIQISLVDSLQKRITFLDEVIRKLELKKIKTYHARAEDFAKEHRESFDVVTARAVAPLSILMEYCMPLVKINKYFIPLKGNISQELEESKKAMEILHGYLEKEISFLLPKEQSNRTILVIKKQEKTPLKYPRKYSEIKKKPL